MQDNGTFWGVMAAWAALAVLAIPIIIIARDRDVILGVFVMIMIIGNLAAFFLWATQDDGHGRESAEDADDAQQIVIITPKKDKDNNHFC